MHHFLKHQFSTDIREFSRVVLLMDEILHQLIGGLSHYLQGFIHPRWCRISSINSSILLYVFFPLRMAPALFLSRFWVALAWVKHLMMRKDHKNQHEHDDNDDSTDNPMMDDDDDDGWWMMDDGWLMTEIMQMKMKMNMTKMMKHSIFILVSIKKASLPSPFICWPASTASQHQQNQPDKSKIASSDTCHCSPMFNCCVHSSWVDEATESTKNFTWRR